MRGEDRVAAASLSKLSQRADGATDLQVVPLEKREAVVVRLGLLALRILRVQHRFRQPAEFGGRKHARRASATGGRRLAHTARRERRTHRLGGVAVLHDNACTPPLHGSRAAPRKANAPSRSRTISGLRDAPRFTVCKIRRSLVSIRQNTAPVKERMRMLQEVDDLREEGNELDALLVTLGEADWSGPRPSSSGPHSTSSVTFTTRIAVRSPHSRAARPFRRKPPPCARSSSAAEACAISLAKRSGRSTARRMRQLWRDTVPRHVRPIRRPGSKARLPWFGPDMGLRMFTTARQMETWAHAQDIYDLLQRPRRYTDRLRNIAHIGASTFGWTFANRHLPLPGPRALRQAHGAVGRDLGMERSRRRKPRGRLRGGVLPRGDAESQRRRHRRSWSSASLPSNGWRSHNASPATRRILLRRELEPGRRAR